ANIYEQRRTSAKVDRTNTILIAGFTSFNDAVERLGDRVTASLDDLGERISYDLGDLQSALEASAQATAHQRDQILDEVREAAQSQVSQLRSEAERRSEYEREARKMLDNIQRRRVPPPSLFT
ncbi:MAG TPA: hypothetical protein VGQ69_01085, partial [Gemmatimonadales bacterium]|nr:hypothetical protein [Gemmatimonadales bacterium]